MVRSGPAPCLASRSVSCRCVLARAVPRRSLARARPSILQVGATAAEKGTRAYPGDPRFNPAAAPLWRPRPQYWGRPTGPFR
jgi:hypothetical protein